MALVSSRVMPSSPNVKTFGASGSGRDYTSLATWESDTRGDITGAGANSPVLECYADTVPFDIGTAVRMQQSSTTHTSSTKFRVIKAASGHENRFRKNAGVIFRGTNYASDVGIIWSDNETYGAIYDIGFTYGALNDSVTRSCIDVKSNASNWRFVGLFVFDLANSGSAPVRGTFARAANITHINCVFDNADYAVVSSIASGKVYYNCTVVNSTSGYYAVNQSATAINCVAEGNTTNWKVVYATWNKTTCTDDGGVVFDTDGISLDSTDTVAIDQGTDLKTAGTVNWNDDGMGRERGDGSTTGDDWDIGALEYYEAAAVTVTTDLDAAIQKTGITATASLDAALQAVKSLQADLDAALQGAKTGQIALDAALQGTNTGYIHLEAVLQAVISTQTDLDAALQIAVSTGASLDAALLAVNKVSASLDAALQKNGMTAAVSFDAGLAERKTASTALDAFLTVLGLADISLDAVLTGRYTTSIGLDAFIRGLIAWRYEVVARARTVSITAAHRVTTVAARPRVTTI